MAELFPQHYGMRGPSDGGLAAHARLRGCAVLKIEGIAKHDFY
jgi:hypothetical protein